MEDMRNCSKGDQTAFYIILCFIIEQLTIVEHNIALEKLSELCCQALADIPNEYVLNDSLSNGNCLYYTYRF